MFQTERMQTTSRNGVFSAFALTTCLALLPAQSMAQLIVSQTFPVHNNATGDSGSDDYPQIATDGAGNWVAVWYSTENLGGTIGPDLDILVALSSDNGVTWGAPAVLNTNATTDTGDDFDVHIETDGSGVWVAVWASDDDLGATIGIDVDILIATSVDNGATWTAPVALNSNATTDAGDDLWPMTVSAGAGVWVAFWDSDDDLGTTIGMDSDILFARSTDNGLNWTAPQELNSNAATDSGSDAFVHLASDGGANWVAVWESDEDLGGLADTDVDIFVSTSSDTGLNWSSPVVLESSFGADTGNDFRPFVTTDAAGNWIATWYSNENVGGLIGTDFDILVSRSFSNGSTWSAPQALNINASIDTGQDFCPMAAVDSAGNWTVVWQSTDDLGGTIGTDSDILGAVSTNNGLAWSFPQPINFLAATDSGDEVFASVGIKADASILIVWYSDDDLGGTIGLDTDIVYANAFISFPGPAADAASGCFVATAAYGTPLDARLDVLREFRDGYLLPTALGSAFVDTYYRLSPALADRVAENQTLAAMTRLFLAPIIALISIFTVYSVGSLLLPALAFVSMFLLMWRRRSSARG